MFGTIPRISPPLGTNVGNTGSLTRVDTMHITNDTINTTTTTNVAQNVVNENLPQLFNSIGGSHVTNVPEFNKEDFTSWKVRFLVFLDGLEPYYLKTLEDGPFVPLSNMSTPTNPLRKPHNQWTYAEARLANQDKRLKTHEGPSDKRDTKIVALRLKFNAFKALEVEREEREDGGVVDDDYEEGPMVIHMKKRLLVEMLAFMMIGDSLTPRLEDTKYFKKKEAFKKHALMMLDDSPPRHEDIKYLNEQAFMMIGHEDNKYLIEQAFMKIADSLTPGPEDVKYLKKKEALKKHALMMLDYSPPGHEDI
nr:hypothetical protein [Tanacetum cinerariifolium]